MQLDSLLTQAHSNWTLHARDDGSTDHTDTVLHTYASRHTRIIYNNDQCGHLGAIASFLYLLQQAPDDADALYAFCDQDDVWRPNKLQRAIDRLAAVDTESEALYCARLEFVDANLRTLGHSRIPSAPGFANALVENMATGCTVVFNAAVRQRMLRAEPRDMLMHDWWSYLCASAFGQIFYDTQPTVLYRRHACTATGFSMKQASNLLFRIPGWLDFLNGSRTLSGIAQGERFAETYPELSEDHRALIQRLNDLRSASLPARLRHALTTPTVRGDPIERLGTRLLLTLGRY